MPSGNGSRTEVHFKGKEDDFVIFVENAAIVHEWRKDKTIPLAQVVDGWKVFCTHKHGAQGVGDAASNAELENEFGTHKEEEVVTQILEKGDVQSQQVSGRVGTTNDNKGSRATH